ncbi:MAG: glycosyltransferase, partial [Pseudomonadota bacterium]
ITFLNGPHRAPLEKAQERMRNAPIVTDLISCDLGLVPTQYQAKQFPPIFQEKLRVMHDGIDTDLFVSANPGEVRLGEDVFTKEDEIVTYVARGMEPYRGFPEFMRALADVQKRRPHLRAIIVGEDRSVYGRALPSGTSYKQEALEKNDLDLSRITFTGLVPRVTYRKILQISSVHVYFTVPFVLSWSLLEAMSTECLILGSNTAPVKEVVTHEKNGLLTDYRDHERVVDDLDYALSLKNNATHLRAAVRETILSRYAAKDLYPAKKALFAHLELT